MSITEGENEFDGDDICEEPKLQWSPFKLYYRHSAIGTRLNHSVVKSLIGDAFPDQEVEKEMKCKELPLLETVISVPCLATILCNIEPCASRSELISDNSIPESTCVSCAKQESVHLWEALQRSFFQKKSIELSGVKWRRHFFDLFSLRTNPLDTAEKELDEEGFVTSKKCSVLDVLDDPSKKTVNKPDPIYSGFGKLRNGFYVSSNGLVFSSEIKLKKFNAKMAELDEKLKHELYVIECQHNKLKAKAEERKLLSQKSESQESDHDEETRESQQLNKDNKPKDKTERKSGLFASLQASLRSGIQGFWEKSSPKEQRRSTVPTEDNDDSEDDTGKLTPRPNSQVPEVDGIDNHDEFTREMEAKGGLTYESADRTVQQLSHDALPPPLSLQSLQAGNQTDK
ncbi:hypothetical protein ACROYT_G001980 [Oculina patagonica]